MTPHDVAMAPTPPGSPPTGAGRRRGLIRDHGGEAYGEARRRERDVVLPDGTTHSGRTSEHWRRVALIVAWMTGKRVGLDTATRMLGRDSGWRSAGKCDVLPWRLRRNSSFRHCKAVIRLSSSYSRWASCGDLDSAGRGVSARRGRA